MYFPWTSSWLLITTNNTIILSVIWKEKKELWTQASMFNNSRFYAVLAKQYARQQ